MTTLRVAVVSCALCFCAAYQRINRDKVHDTGVDRACKQDDECPFDGSSYMRCCPVDGKAPGCPDAALIAQQAPSTAKCTLPGFFGDAMCTCTKPPQCVSESVFGWPYKSPIPGKKQWLMIGDSISYQSWNGLFRLPNTTSLGYQVFHVPGNAGNVWWGSYCLDEWLGEDPARWDIISFNFGLHDLALTNERVEPDTYGKLLANIALRIAKAAPNAALFYADTTPVPLGSDGPCDMSGNHEQGGCPPRKPQDVAIYNKAAETALSALPFKISKIALHKMVTSRCGSEYEECGKFQLRRSVHFGQDGILALGAAYLDAVEAATISA